MTTIVSTNKIPRKESFACPEHKSLWVIVLAGGEGTRMRPVIERWLGKFRPKQYCTFVGTRSMLQHTLDRAGSITDPDKILTVIGSSHRAYLDETVHFPPGAVIEQPANRGTAVGIFLALSLVLEQDPQATVLVLPSDHFIHPEKHFIRYAMESLRLAQRLDGRLVLLGAVPTRPETDYGWIDPGPKPTNLFTETDMQAMEVAGFLEKPGKTTAEKFYRRKCLWNTMIFAMNANALWNLGNRLMPAVMARFLTFRTVWRVVQEKRVPANHLPLVLAHIYANLPAADFSRHILQEVVADTVVVPIHRVHWSDWGRPERVAETLAELGSRPAFQVRHFSKTVKA